MKFMMKLIRLMSWRQRRHKMFVLCVRRCCHRLCSSRPQDSVQIIVGQMLVLMGQHRIIPEEFGLKCRADIGRLACDTHQRFIKLKRAEVDACGEEILKKLFDAPPLCKEDFLDQVAELGPKYRGLRSQLRYAEGDQQKIIQELLRKHDLLEHNGK